jgi:hypothetical protein
MTVISKRAIYAILSVLLPVLLLVTALLIAGHGHHPPTETDLLNREAALPAPLPASVLDWRAINSSVDRAHGTMALLTGNDTAVQAATAAAEYPEGSELALTTWLQRDDPHWFGAKIPGTFVSIETVTIARAADGKPAAIYKQYTGNPLHEVTDTSTAARQAAILSMHASQLP